MEQICQKVMLDSCVVIELIEKKRVADRLCAALKGKPVSIVLCDVVLKEICRVRGFTAAYVIGSIMKRIRKNVTVSQVSDEQRIIADSVTEQYQICHRGDNMILAICKASNFVLLTFDKMLLKTCEWVGVAAFHPFRAGGI